jgi:uncharacterized membrane protein YbhN (UPF0104 family)
MTNHPLPDDPASRRRLLPPWVGPVARIAMTAALLAYALRGVKWEDQVVDGQVVSGMRTVLAGADWRWWLAGMGLAMLVQVVAGIRWAELARPLGFDFPRRMFVWRFFEGMFFSLCLPSSIGGDVVKAYRIGDTTPRRLLAGCSVLADRLTGLSALAVLGGAALAARKYDLSLPVTLAVAAALLAVVLGAFLLAVSCLDTIIAVLPEGGPFRGFLSELLPYQQRPSLIAKAVIGKSGVMQTAFLPVLIDKQLRPEVIKGGDARFADAFRFMEWASADFPHRFAVQGDEIVIHQGD